jgi:NAD(P)-dependent dehydrogenase (short-subunit alcohol dehydrogenase family)
MNGSEFAGKKILITGAGRGIGAAMARGFAQAGAALVLAARSERELNETTAACGNAYAVPTDMGDLAQVERLAAKTLEHLGGIDIIISNAAYAAPFSTFLDLTNETWEQTMRVNVGGPLALLRALIPHMVGPGANIIIVSSIRGTGGTPYNQSYGASKAALNQLTQTLAVELGPMGIRVNAILPGPVDTEMVRSSLNGNQALFDHYADIAPVAGWTMPEDMVGPAMFLAGACARKVNGHLLVVDGGLKAINQDAFPPPVHLLNA